MTKRELEMLILDMLKICGFSPQSTTMWQQRAKNVVQHSTTWPQRSKNVTEREQNASRRLLRSVAIFDTL